MTLPEQARSSSAAVALGGGRGLTSVLRALRNEDGHLTVIAGIAGEEDQDDGAQHRLTGPVGDLRRSLEALSDEDGALLHAIRRQLTVDGVGQHRLGDLTLAAAADALGGYGSASIWLGEQLGIDGAVLPATVEPARWQIEEVEQDAIQAPPGGSGHRVRQLRFVGDRIDSPAAAITAISDAQWVLLTPGAMYRSMLSTCAAPDLAAALRSTSARVVWIANLAPDPGDAPDMTAIDHVHLIRLHGLRVDVVLHDPSAALSFDPVDLAHIGVESVARPLRSATDPAAHDPERLRSALTTLLASPAAPLSVVD